MNFSITDLIKFVWCSIRLMLCSFCKFRKEFLLLMKLFRICDNIYLCWVSEVITIPSLTIFLMTSYTYSICRTYQMKESLNHLCLLEWSVYETHVSQKTISGIRISHILFFLAGNEQLHQLCNLSHIFWSHLCPGRLSSWLDFQCF